MKLLVFLTILLSFSLNAADLKVGYIEFPPISYTDEKGMAAGIFFDITSRVLDLAGYKLITVPLPVNRMAKMLVDGEIDLWVGPSTLPQFKGKVEVGDIIIDNLVLQAYSIEQEIPIKVREDLLGKTLLIIRGYSYGGWISYIKDKKNKIHYIEFKSHGEALKRLYNLTTKRREVLMLGYKHAVNFVLESDPIVGLKSSEVSSLPVHFVISKRLKNSKAVLKKLEQSYIELFRSNKIERCKYH